MLRSIRREYMYLVNLHVFRLVSHFRRHRYIWDTCQIHQDTCILGASLVSHWIHIRIHRDTCGIHMRYIGKHEWIHVSQMPPERDVSEMQSGYIFWETCGIHAGYMYKYHILKGNQDPSGYMQDAHEIHEEDVRDTYLWNLGGRLHHREAR